MGLRWYIQGARVGAPGRYCRLEKKTLSRMTKARTGRLTPGLGYNSHEALLLVIYNTLANIGAPVGVRHDKARVRVNTAEAPV